MARFDSSPAADSLQDSSLPKRSKKYGVGKEIGGAVYVHRRYQHVFGSAVEEARSHLPSGFSYTVVKLNLANKSFSFVVVADFDTAPEPTIGTVITVRTDGSSRRITAPRDPFIYHHKWLFVAEDYGGFDLEESKRRSLAWLALPDLDKSRIGRKTYWEEHVVPQLQFRVHRSQPVAE